MIVLQILIIPFFVLTLLGVVFLIGVAGMATPRRDQ